LTDEAQKEASELMLTSKNILKPATGEPVTIPSQDIVLGCYYLTKIKEVEGEKKGEIKLYSTVNEAMAAFHDSHIKINQEIRIDDLKTETSIGRLIFNEALPKDFGFINKSMGKKDLQKLVAALIEKYGLEKTWPVLDAIKKTGFLWASFSGISWGMKDLVVPPEKKEILKNAEKEIVSIRSQFEEGLLTETETREKVISVWEKAGAEIAKGIPDAIKSTSVFNIIDSGSRGSWSQPIQMSGMKGLVQNAQGQIIELPIKNSYKEGLTVLEFFINTHGARKGLIDTALKTAQAGYLTRRLVDVSQDMVIKETDCHTKKGIEVARADGEEFGYKLGLRLFGRTALEDIKAGRKTIVKANEIITSSMAEEIEKSEIQSVWVRSPITCKTLYGVCSKCYGLDLGRGEAIKIGEAVGIVAAQSIGEPGTQLTLRTFHTGGVAGLDITHGLPRVQELFEVRIPKGKAPLAQADGIIEEIEESGAMRTIRFRAEKTGKAKTEKMIEYSVPKASMLFVKEGDKVEKGTQLCEGSVDLKELFKFKGREAVEKYIINQVQNIYVSEGTNISDKHIEIIIKQMFSRVAVKEPGDTDFVIGEVVEKSKFMEANREVKSRNKQPAKGRQMLTGITKTALSAESFLSSASFQETARVLVMAASEGREDNLRGLKENVIIGRLIPAGTGFKKKSKK
jgi:DNA-directed RNA polymerase subunit beta'